MSNLRSSVLLVILTSAGISYGSPDAAQPTQANAPIPARTIPPTRGEIPPPSPAKPSVSGARAYRAEERNKATPKDTPRALPKSDKPQGSSIDRSRRVNDVLLADTVAARPRKKGRLGTIAAKVRDATTGKGKSSDSKWSRTQETASP
jgi:hypothetical protein